MLRVYLLSWLLRSLKHFLESCEIQWHIIKGLSMFASQSRAAKFRAYYGRFRRFFRFRRFHRFRRFRLFRPSCLFSIFWRAAYLATWLARHLAVWLAHHLASCLLGWLPGYLCSCLAISLPGWLAAHKDSEHKVDSEHTK